MIRYVSMTGSRAVGEAAEVPGRELAAGPSVVRSPIGRREHARARVLRAALEILAAEGLPGLTMEAIARRAGASKATLYRRWKSRTALLVDAMGSTFVPLAPPSTGEVRADLIALLRTGQGLLDSQPFARLMAAVIDAAERDESLATMHDELTDRRREPIRSALLAAKERGEISKNADVELATDLLVGPAFYRRFVAHRPFPDGYAEAVVDGVLDSIRPVRRAGAGHKVRMPAP
jgi:AcrR family transcriptional regulator